MPCNHRYVTTYGNGWFCCSCKAPMLSLAVQIFGKPPAQATHPTKDTKQ